MNTIEQVPYPSEEELALLMRKYKYNLIQMKVMQKLGYNDDNFAGWKTEYSDKFRDRFISYINVYGLFEDENGVIDIENAASVIADYLQNKADVKKAA